jgi:transposase
MPKIITLESHLTTEQLYKRYRACQKSNEKPRWRALYLISSGIRAAEAARSVGRTSGWISQLTARYNSDGASAVADRRGDSRKTGRVPTVTAELAVKLETALQSNAADGGVWTAKKVALWIEQQTGRKLHETSAWRVLRLLGFTLQTVRPAHQRSAAPEEQAEFKKN